MRQTAAASTRKALCVFEYVYFARPDSLLDGKMIHNTRQHMGSMLAREAPAEADLLIPHGVSYVPLSERSQLRSQWFIVAHCAAYSQAMIATVNQEDDTSFIGVLSADRDSIARVVECLDSVNVRS